MADQQEQWPGERMVNMPHPHEPEMRVIGYVLPADKFGGVHPSAFLDSLSSSQQVREDALAAAISACNSERLIDATGEASDIAYGYAIDHCINAINQLKSRSPTPAPELLKPHYGPPPTPVTLPHIGPPAEIRPLSQPSSVAMTDAAQLIREFVQAMLANDTAASGDAMRRMTDFALQSSPASSTAPEAGYYLASFKRGNIGHVTWWGPNDAGYTPYLEQAGIYHELTPDYHDSEYTVPVPVAFAREFVSSVIDTGHSGHECWWSADKLRAAISRMRDEKGGA